jgi:hypothetical protein
MKIFFALILWLLVLTFAPMVAIATLVLLPIVWLISLPFRLISLVVEAFFSLAEGVLFLPARLLLVRRA